MSNGQVPATATLYSIIMALARHMEPTLLVIVVQYSRLNMNVNIGLPVEIQKNQS